MAPATIMSLALNGASIICSLVGMVLDNQAITAAGRALCIAGCSICLAQVLNMLA